MAQHEAVADSVPSRQSPGVVLYQTVIKLCIIPLWISGTGIDILISLKNQRSSFSRQLNATPEEPVIPPIEKEC